MKLFLFLVNEVATLLARYAFLDEVLAVGLHGWPEVTDAKDSGSHGARVGMVAAYSLM